MSTFDQRQERICVPEKYDEIAYRVLWTGIKAAQIRLAEKLNRKKIGHRLFYENEIIDVVRKNSHRFYQRNLDKTYDESRLGSELELKGVPYYAGDDCKIMYRFLVREQAVTDITLPFFKTIFCYLSVIDRNLTKKIEPINLLEQTGSRFGQFLREPKSYLNMKNLAIDKQKLLGIYSYYNKNATRAHTGQTRYLAFLGGFTNEYIFAFDFYLDLSEIRSYSNQLIQIRDENIRLYYGFCIPSDEFSPVIMRSWCLGERLTGLIYTPNALIDFDDPRLNLMKMDFFTTDRYRINDKDISDQQPNTILKSAQIMFNGPRIQTNLTKIQNSNDIIYLSKRIEKFMRDHLQ